MLLHLSSVSRKMLCFHLAFCCQIMADERPTAFFFSFPLSVPQSFPQITGVSRESWDWPNLPHWKSSCLNQVPKLRSASLWPHEADAPLQQRGEETKMQCRRDSSPSPLQFSTSVWKFGGKYIQHCSSVFARMGPSYTECKPWQVFSLPHLGWGTWGAEEWRLGRATTTVFPWVFFNVCVCVHVCVWEED